MRTENREITQNTLRGFRQQLIREEKSRATIEKYLRDAKAFAEFIGDRPLEQETVIAYAVVLSFCALIY